MSALLRLGAFGLVLAAVLVLSALTGRAVGPFERAVAVHDESGEAVEEAHEPVDHDPVAPSDDHAHGPGEPAGAAADGLAVAAGSLRIEPASAVLSPGAPEPFAFRIVGADGRAVRDLDVTHERRMHLILVRRDLAGFQHLHPEQRPDGSWAVTVLLPLPGICRAFADFSAAGRPTVLSLDVHAAGAFEPLALPAPSSSAPAGPYTVELGDSSAAAGADVTLDFAVTRDGRPARLEPYLGAGGHLVVLRDGDLAFLHTHPEEGDPTAEPGRISFETRFPSAGRYRAFLQFRAGGAVRTAEFTIEVARP